MSSHSNRYCVVNASDLNTIDFSQVEDTSSETLRYSLDRSKFIVEYSGTKPAFLSSLSEYTHSEIKALTLDFDEGWEEDELD